MSSKSLNKVLLIGNLTRDPNLKTTPNGAYICTFSVATNSNYKKPNGDVAELTEYHNIVAWSKLAEICSKKLKKGDKVYLEGELRTRLLDEEGGAGGNDEKKYKKTEVRITEMILVRSMSEGSGSSNSSGMYDDFEDDNESTNQSNTSDNVDSKEKNNKKSRNGAEEEQSTPADTLPF